ncbi:MAG: hypothetical protein A2X94_15555 [Bdellovibrionales bacterium GWB1_55_8]|nr:MAG: hypothetical protein A2X94_15555 [Bdellovibrionales bacterium GWB1_55_8]
MKTPDWKTCTEEELWRYVAFHLKKAGVDSVLVGGAVVAIYSQGAYRSGDLDMIVARSELPKVDAVLATLGFQKVRGRHFEHPDCAHIIIEFPAGPISIGDDYKIQPKEVEVEGSKIKIFTPTDCVRDRLASYIHFDARECLDQAVLVATRQPVDLAKVKEWCRQEGGMDAYKKFEEKLRASGTPGRK